MVDQKQIVNEFYEQAWKILELVKNSKEEKEFHNKFMQELAKLCEILKQMPAKMDNASFRDVHDFFSPGMLLYLGKKSVKEVTFEDLKRGLDKKIVGEPFTYNFYFRLGRASDFPEGYQIGSGKLYPFTKLPKHVRDYISLDWKYEYRDNPEFARTLKEYKEYRRQDWYMHIEVKSVGWNRATEKAIQIARRNMNIYKMVYFTESYFEHIVGLRTPFDYCFSVRKGGSMGSARTGGSFDMPFYRVDLLDKMISDINSIVEKANQSELERRILNAIDIFGMIDQSTPLHVRFMLCIIALEGLLLSRGDKDYLGWKLAEKISFLLGDSFAWNVTTYNIDPKDSKMVTKEFTAKRLAESRIRLNKQVQELYDKRSSFAHKGLAKKKKSSKEITPDDYHIASSIVRWAVEKLLGLRSNGITHVAKENKVDNNSLDGHIEKLKYG